MTELAKDIKQQFISQLDGLISRDINRLSRFGTIALDDKEHLIGGAAYIKQAERFIAVEEKDIDYDAFDAWYKKNDYTKRFPDYTGTYSDKKLLAKKAFEHWLSLEETKDAPGGAFLDVGCATSPFSDLVEQTMPDDCKICYRVDLPLPEYGFKPGVHGKVVGCSASDIPLKKSSASRIYSHNAIEHFEGDLYYGFFKEAGRLLKKGGVIFICPLFFAKKSFTYVSLTGIYRRLAFPKLTKGVDLVYSDKIGQPYAYQIGVDDLERRLVNPLKGVIDFKLIHYRNARERGYGVSVSLHGVKR